MTEKDKRYIESAVYPLTSESGRVIKGVLYDLLGHIDSMLEKEGDARYKEGVDAGGCYRCNRE